MTRSLWVGVALVVVMALTDTALAQETPKAPPQKQEQKEPEVSPELKARIGKLIAQLGDDDFEKREAAQAELITIGKPALAQLEKALKENDDPEVRNRAAQIIEHIGIRGRLPVGLLAGFPNIDKRLMKSQITTDLHLTDLLDEILKGKPPGSYAAAVVREVLRHGAELSPEAKKVIAEEVGRRDIREAADCLGPLLKDKHESVRRVAAEGLGTLGAKEYARDFAELLKDEDSNVRWWVAFVLGDLGAKEYARDIAGLLKDEDAGVREYAAEALDKLNGRAKHLTLEEQEGELREMEEKVDAAKKRCEEKLTELKEAIRHLKNK